MSTLRILAAANESAQLRWVRIDGKESGSGKLGDLARQVEDTTIELIVPAERTSLIPVKLSPEQLTRLSDSNLQWLVEPLVSQELEQLHLVRGDVSGDGILTVFAVDRNWLQTTVANLVERQLRPDHILLEILLVEWQPQTWTLVLKPEGGFVRTGEQSALILDRHTRDTPPIVLQMAAREHPQPTEIRILQSPEAGNNDFCHWSPQLGIAVRPGGKVDWQNAQPKKTIDLAKGTFAPRGQMRNIAARLKLAAWLVVGIASLNLVGSGIKTAINQQEKAQLEAEIEAILRKSVPRTTAILNPVLQMRKNLDHLSKSTGAESGNDFLPLIEKLKNITGNQLAGKIAALTFAADQWLELTISDQVQAQQTGERLKAAGFAAQIEANSSGNAVRIRLKPSS